MRYGKVVCVYVRCATKLGKGAQGDAMEKVHKEMRWDKEVPEKGAAQLRKGV